jgi:hypothetical protein
MSIPDTFSDEDVVYKYGMTKDLDRRSQELQNDIGKIPCVSLGLKLYTFVDSEYISDAELYLKNIFQGMNMKLDYENRAELVVIPNSKFSIVKNHYNTVSNLYAGSVRETIEKLRNIEREYAYEMKMKEIELERKTSEFYYQLEMKNKDIEVRDTKMIMMENQLDSLKIISDLKHKLLDKLS